MIEVHHRKNPDFGAFAKPNPTLPLKLYEFEFVAKVDADDLETAYHLTNNITKAWQENDRVEAMGKAKQGARSSSVGDVFVVVGDPSEIWIVKPFGFAMVPLDQCVECEPETRADIQKNKEKHDE